MPPAASGHNALAAPLKIAKCATMTQNLGRRTAVPGTTQERPDMATIRMAQVGTKHGHAAGKLQAMLDNPSVEVVGVFEPDAAKRRRRTGATLEGVAEGRGAGR